MEDYQISRDMQRGEQARQLLENPLLCEAFSTIEKEIFKVWQETKTADSHLREEAWMNQRAMNLLKMKLESWINNGKIAGAELEKKAQRVAREKKAKASLSS